MAVSVDTVYQRVLALANKEQRGYITPQEFNLFANQAQMDIFEQYFYDLNQFRRLPGNNTEYADMVDILNEKIDFFSASSSLTSIAATPNNIYPLPADHYRTIRVGVNTNQYGGPDQASEIEKLTYKEFLNTRNSPLTKHTLARPVYYQKDVRLIVNPTDIVNGITIYYIKQPTKVKWSSYTIGAGETYDSTNSVDFELHPSEETKLVIKILGLAGITLKDPGLYQIAGAEDNKNIQQEKQ